MDDCHASSFLFETLDGKLFQWDDDYNTELDERVVDYETLWELTREDARQRLLNRPKKPMTAAQVLMMNSSSSSSSACCWGAAASPEPASPSTVAKGLGCSESEMDEEQWTLVNRAITNVYDMVRGKEFDSLSRIVDLGEAATLVTVPVEKPKRKRIRPSRSGPAKKTKKRVVFVMSGGE
jgi:hypothetical protein